MYLCTKNATVNNNCNDDVIMYFLCCSVHVTVASPEASFHSMSERGELMLNVKQFTMFSFPHI